MSDPGAFKLDHLQPVEMILSKISIFLPGVVSREIFRRFCEKPDKTCVL